MSPEMLMKMMSTFCPTEFAGCESDAGCKAQMQSFGGEGADEAGSDAAEKACNANKACKPMMECLMKMQPRAGPDGPTGPTAAEVKKAQMDAAKQQKELAQQAVTAACGSRRSARDAACTACNERVALLPANTPADQVKTAKDACLVLCDAGIDFGFDFENNAPPSGDVDPTPSGGTDTTESAACTQARQGLALAEQAVDDASGDSAATAAASVLAVAVAAAAALF